MFHLPDLLPLQYEIVTEEVMKYRRGAPGKKLYPPLPPT